MRRRRRSQPKRRVRRKQRGRGLNRFKPKQRGGNLRRFRPKPRGQGGKGIGGAVAAALSILPLLMSRK